MHSNNDGMEKDWRPAPLGDFEAAMNRFYNNSKKVPLTFDAAKFGYEFRNEEVSALQARVKELEDQLVHYSSVVNGNDTLSNENLRLRNENELYGRFAERFGDLSCCYDAADVTHVMLTWVENIKEENARLQKLVDMNQKVVDAAMNQVKLQEKNTVPSLIRAIRELDGGNVADKYKCHHLISDQIGVTSRCRSCGEMC